jgi:TrwC relaxase
MPPRRVMACWPPTTANAGKARGVWVGSGLAGIDGLEAGDAVSAEQMRALFGAGMHPLAMQRLQQLDDADLADANIEAATRLGLPFKISDTAPSRSRAEVAKRIAALNEQAGLPADWPVSPAETARICTEIAWELFAAEHGRPPADAREVAGDDRETFAARAANRRGLDLTFSPVKSVSTLWAVADPQIAGTDRTCPSGPNTGSTPTISRSQVSANQCQLVRQTGRPAGHGDGLASRFQRDHGRPPTPVEAL